MARSKIGEEIGQRRPFRSPEHECLVGLLRTTDVLRRSLSRAVEPYGVTLQQYNVLRILRGAPEGLSCGDIGSRLITHDPDITRLLDRLEKRGLISRCRESKDRRMVLTRITPEGLKRLARLDEPVQEAHRGLLGHLGRDRLRALRALLRASRGAPG